MTWHAKLEVAAVAAITVAGFLVRTWSLASLPMGLLGDEAISGLEARRILHQGFIGVYSSEAAGLPAGTLYLMAAAAALFGESIVALRLVSAILGTATIPVFYLLVRRYSGCRPAYALAGALIFACTYWHVFYSRLAIPPAGLPLVTTLAAVALLEAMRTDKDRWWVLAGFLHGATIYVYDAYGPYLAVAALFVAGLVVIRRLGVEQAVVFVLALALTALPMLAYTTDPANDYFGHLRRDFLWQQAQWQTAPLVGRAGLLASRYLAWWRTALNGPASRTG